MNGRVFKSTVRLLYFPMLCCVLLSRTHDIVPLCNVENILISDHWDIYFSYPRSKYLYYDPY